MLELFIYLLHIYVYLVFFSIIFRNCKRNKFKSHLKARQAVKGIPHHETCRQAALCLELCSGKPVQRQIRKTTANSEWKIVMLQLQKKKKTSSVSAFPLFWGFLLPSVPLLFKSIMKSENNLTRECSSKVRLDGETKINIFFFCVLL